MTAKLTLPALAVSSTLLFSTMPASAASGDIDTSFGNNGWVETVVLPDTIAPADEAHAVAQQADGKLVVVGHAQVDGNYDVVLTRYNNDGSIDTGFGNNGVVVQPIGDNADRARGIVIQDDGKLVITGVKYNIGTTTDIFLARYFPDGSLDPEFGSDGIVITAISGGRDSANNLLLQPDGKLIVAGSSASTSMLARYNTDGSLDTSFNGTGIAASPTGFTFVDVALQTDGKLVASGSLYTGSSGNFLVTRFNADGSIDNEFGTDGTVITDLGGSDVASNLIVQADGKVVVVGHTYKTPTQSIAIARYNSDGTLDNSFDTDGVLALSIGTSKSYGWDILEDADGKLVIAAEIFFSGSSTGTDIALLRLNSNGSLDASFNSDGIAYAAIDASSNYLDKPSRLLQQADGKLVVVGTTYANPASNGMDFSIARFNTDGALDNNFSGNGTLRQQLGTPGSEAYMNGLALQADGRIIAGGHATALGPDPDAVVVRYGSNGQLDTGFGSNGIAQTVVSGTQRIRATLLQHDGKIVSVGETYASNYNLLLLRHNSDGSADTTFGNNGQVHVNIISNNSHDSARAVIQQSDGKLVVVGESYNQSLARYVSVISRYNSDGSLDTSFSDDGIAIADVTPGNNHFNNVLQQDDDKLLVVGQASDGSTTRVSLVRFNNDGTLDSGFGNGGVRLATPGGGSAGGVDLTTQSDGRIVVALSANGNFALMRFNSDGSTDASFANNGSVQKRVGSSWNTTYAMATQDDGKLLLLGRSYSETGIAKATLLRFTPDGGLDPYFGTNGVTVIDRHFAFPTGLALLADGSILVGGSDRAPVTFLITRVIANSPDADADGVPDDFDAFPNDPTETADSDGDGIGDNADAFPADPAETADSDSDGVGDNADAFPNNSDASLDNDNDGLPDSWNLSCNATCQESSSLTLDALPDDGDNDGIPDASDNVVGDDNPPTVIAPMDISLVATGDTTEVVLGVATASDVTDGTLSALPDTTDNATTVSLAPGRHVITWSARDTAGNTGSDTQVVEITPLVRFSSSAQTVGEGSLVTITVTLNGNALAYPVTIPLELDASSTATNPADHDGTSNTIVIEESADPANTGSYQFVAGDDGLTGEADETVIFNIVADNGVDVLANAAIDTNASQHIVTLTELNVAPVMTGVRLSDGANETLFDGTAVDPHTLVRRNRQVMLTAELTDANPEDSHAFSWLINDVLQAETGAVLTLDLLDFDVGHYTISVQAVDDANPPEYSNILAADITLVPPPAIPLVRDSSGGALHWFSLLGILLMVRRRTA